MIRLLILLAAATIEAVPLALAVGLVSTWDTADRGAEMSPVLLIVAVGLAYGLTRLVMQRRLAERPARVVLVLAALAAAPALLQLGHIVDVSIDYAGVRGLNLISFMALAALLYAWSRGTVLAREDLLFDAIYASFRRGLILLFVVLLLVVMAAADAAQAAAAHRLLDEGWGRVIVFFLAGLCALSLARVEEERRRGAGPEGPPPVRSEWLVTLLGVTGAVALVGVVLASFVTPATAALVLASLGGLADVVRWLLTPLIWLSALLTDLLIRLLRPLFHVRPLPVQKTPVHGTRRLPIGAHVNPQQTLAVAHTLLVAIALIVACIALWYAFFYRQRGATASDGEEERESLWSWAMLWAGLRAALRRLWMRLFGGRNAGTPADAGAVEPGGVLSIRAIYRRLLARAAALGLARRGNETPHEYLARLRGALPAGERDAALLTGLYTRARYGPSEPAPGDVAAAGEIWTRLEPVLRQKGVDGPLPSSRSQDL